MSYKTIFGHAKQIAILQSAVQRSRIAHAYLFYGMEGIGKRTVAISFAKALLCSHMGDAESCDHCPSCLKIDHNNHPDVVMVEPDGAFIKLQAIKDMMAAMAFRPLEGGKRIFIVVDAETMHPTAANALLKTLEEPSRANVLILVASRPHQLPMTILSRCQHIRFHPLAPQEVSRFLQERLSLDEAMAAPLASSSGGSISRAIQLNRDDYLTMRREILNYLAESREKNPLETLFFIQFMGKDKRNLSDKLEVLKTCFRDALLYRELGHKEGLINADREDTIRAVVSRSTATDMVNNIRVLDRLTRALEQNANKTLTLEAAMFKLAL